MGFCAGPIWLPTVHCVQLLSLSFFFFFSFLIFVCHQLCHRFCPLSISLSWFRPFRDSSLAQGAGLPRLAKDSSPFSHCLPGLLRSRPQGSLQCNWLGIAPHDMSICEKCPSPTCENISPPTTERIGRYHKDKEGESFLAGGVVRRAYCEIECRNEEVADEVIKEKQG